MDAGTGITQDSPYADVIYQQQTDTPFIAVTSQPFGGKTAAAWTDTFLGASTGSDSCGATEPYTIDGVSGVIAYCGDLGYQAVVAAGHRAHVIWLYRIDDLDWFKTILDSAQLNPAAAV